MNTFWFLPPGCTLWQRNKEVGDLHLNNEHRFNINEITVHYVGNKTCKREVVKDSAI